MNDDRVISGYFSPPTHDDIAVLTSLLALDSPLTVVIRNADRAPSTQAPWSADLREAMVRDALGPLAGQVSFQHIRDSHYRHVQGPAANDGGEAIREAYLREGADAIADLVPEAVCDILRAWQKTPDYARLRDEQKYVDDYRASWASAPWPPIFVTVDAVIEHGAHILLIRRGGQPGRGQWALPGGFLESDEPLLLSAVREVREETSLELSEDDIARHLIASHVFDYPKRSARGRTITHGYHFRFPAGPLPTVEAADDAEGAHWVALDQLAGMRDQFFEDHADILEYFFGSNISAL